MGLIFVVLLISFVYTRFSYLGSGIIIPEPDEWYWHNSSQSLATNIIPTVGNKPMVTHPPLFEYLGYATNLVVKDSKQPLTFVSTRLVSVLASFLLALVMYFYIKRKVGQQEAIYSLFLVVLTPIILFYSKLGLHELLFALTLFVFYLCFEKLVTTKPSVNQALITGASLALAIASKNTALIFMAIPLLNLGLSYLDTTKTSIRNWKNIFKMDRFFPTWRDQLIPPVIVVVSSLGLVSLYYLPAIVLYPRLVKDAFLVSTIAHSADNFSQISLSFFYYLNHLTLWLTLPVIVLTIFGLINLYQKRFKGWRTLVIFLLFITVILFTNEPRGRYFMMITPFLVVLAALGFQLINTLIPQSVHYKVVNLSVPLVIFVFMLPTSLLALESTNHSVVEKATQYIRNQIKQGFEAKYVFSSYWPNIIQETLGYPTVRFTSSLLDANRDYNEYPNYSPKVNESPIDLMNKENGFVLIHQPPDYDDLRERRQAATIIKKNYKPSFISNDNKPNFPENIPNYQIWVYKIQH